MIKRRVVQIRLRLSVSELQKFEVNVNLLLWRFQYII